MEIPTPNNPEQGHETDHHDLPPMPDPRPKKPIYKESHIRSVVKGVTWRMVGTVDTIVLSYIFTGKIKTAVAIGATEVFTKVFLYYMHERLWQAMPRGAVRRWLKNRGIKLRWK